MNRKFQALRNVQSIWDWNKELLTIAEIYNCGLVLYFVLKGLLGWHLWPLNLVGEVIQWLLLPAFPTAILFVCLRRWRSAGISVANVAAWLMLFGSLFLPRFGPIPVCSALQPCFDLTTISYNVAAGLPDNAELVELLRTSDADVIGLQEVSVEQAYVIGDELADLYPYRVIQPPLPSEGIVVGMGVLSRYPIVNASYHPKQNNYQSSYLVVPIHLENHQFVSIVVTHLLSPRLRFAGASSLQNVGARAEQTSLSLINSVSENAPLILLADMNSTSQSIQYATFSQGGLIDAYRVRGHGLGLTYPSGASNWRRVPPVPLVRIDMIWLQGYFEVVDSWVIREAVSDHRAVAARVLWYSQRHAPTSQNALTARTVERNGRLLCLPASNR